MCSGQEQTCHLWLTVSTGSILRESTVKAWLSSALTLCLGDSPGERGRVSPKPMALKDDLAELQGSEENMLIVGRLGNGYFSRDVPVRRDPRTDGAD